RWTLLIVRDLLRGVTRFSEFQRNLSMISPTLLNKRLKSLEDQGLLVKRTIPSQKRTEYQPTAMCKELGPVVATLGEWGMRWARGQMDESELDVELLMSDIRLQFRPEKLPAGQTVVHFQFPELRQFGRWWITVKEEEEVDLCCDDPGLDVDVYVTADLRTLVEVHMGDCSLSSARDSGKVRVQGPPSLLRNISEWLGVNVFAGIRPAERISA
ncbi:MAG: helix-turn-helix transcriptional regulator, partial [Verrucomicrobiae bacterium]|nr:helix-turn-helix transcriptional regulator [Verrucomicrobiae bacterium]